MRNPNSVLAISILLAFVCCNSKETENRLRAENDSLRKELETRYSVVVSMRDVKGLLDSIDISRNVLRADLNEGTSYNNVNLRLKDINEYVVKTETKLSTIEKELKSSKGQAYAYMMMVSALKDELSIRSEEIQVLEKQVLDYKKENTGLVKTVKLQEGQLSELHTKIDTKQQELALLEAKVNELVENFKVSEGEAFYARAKAVEEAANRTKLAPHKKRETYKEALELYKKALSLGKSEAQENILTLEKKIR